MARSRIKSTGLNFASGMAYKLLTTFCTFGVRTVFIHTLGTAYLGVHGLYSGILSMLSLMELGFGHAMAYTMYKPLAEKNYVKLGQLMQLYRKVYTIVGAVVLLLGLCVVPFMDHLIKNKPDIDHLTLYYLMFLGNTVLSYWFFAYRTSILRADQRAYVITNYHGVFYIINSIMHLIVLLVFKNFTIYLAASMAVTIIKNICIAIKVGKEYPVFKEKPAEPLPIEERKQIFNNTKATMLQKLSYKVLNSSDALIISSFVGIEWVGLISNYIVLENTIAGLITQITGAMHSSLGNYFATESKEKGYLLFKRVEFLTFLLFGFSAVALITLSTPFVKLWLGDDFTVGEAIVVTLIMRFFVEGYMNTMSTFRSSLGLFYQGRWLPLVAAILNIGLSIGLSYPYGAAGVLAATPLTRLLVNMWYMPLIIHRDGFNRPVRQFYFDYLGRVSVLAVFTVALYFFGLWYFKAGVTVLKFVGMMAITVVVAGGGLFLCFCRRPEMAYILEMAAKPLKHLKRA